MKLVFKMSKNLEFITNSGDISFISTVVKVGSKKIELSNIVDHWLKENADKFPHIDFYVVDINKYEEDEADPMLGDILPRFKTLPVFLFYSNNSLVASVSELNTKNFTPTIEDTISQVLPDINRKVVDHGFVNDILRGRIDRSGEKGPLTQQPPFKSKKPLRDESVYLDKYSKR